MSIKVHIARVGIFTVDHTGNRIDKNSPNTSINQLRATRQDALVIPNSDLPNTSGYPTIESYIISEADDGYELLYMDSSFIITGTPGAATSTDKDAFGRIRSSEPYTLGDYKHLYSTNTNFINKTANGGTVAHSSNKVAAILTTSSDPSSSAIHQSKLYHHYQPGKSQLIYTSMVLGGAVSNVTKRIGYFDDRNGIYLEQTGDNTLNWVIRNFATGSVIETNTRISQGSWNKDPCDGSGPSGIQIDVSSTLLIFIDFQWLGVGVVRCGIVNKGQHILCHEFYHTGLNTVYMSNPNLPVRSEIFNTGATTGATLEHICASVQSEGGYKEVGTDWEISNPSLRATPIPGGTAFPVIALRLKNSYKGLLNRMHAIISNIGLYVETTAVKFTLVKLPDQTSLSTSDPSLVWTSVDNDSGCEYCVNATGYTAANAENMFGGFASSGTSQNSRSQVGTGGITSSRTNFITQNYDSTNSEVYAMIVQTLSTGNNDTANVVCSLQWREIY